MKIQNKDLAHYLKQCKNNIPIQLLFIYFVIFVAHLVEIKIQCLVCAISSQSTHVLKSQIWYKTVA